MKLSVVIPGYNEVGPVKQIVESVKKALVDEPGIIVVDEHSKDGTMLVDPQFLSRCRQRHPRSA